MAILMRIIKLFLVLNLVAILPFDSAATDLTLHPNLNVSVIYNNKESITGCIVPGCISRASSMAIDPLTGNIFIGHQSIAGGNILVVSASGTFIGEIPFVSEGLGFAPDGTLYFGVSTLLLAVWHRDFEDPTDITKGIFRIFSNIPKVRDVQVINSGEIMLSIGSFGPAGLISNAVVSVDPGTGYFQPDITQSEVNAAIGNRAAAQSHFTFASDNTVFISYENGTTVRKNPAGVIEEVNSRPGRLQGLNRVALTIAPDDTVYQLDPVAGEIFAIAPDGTVRLIAFGNELKSELATSTMATDGNFLYVANESGRIFEFSTNGSDLSSIINTDLGTGSVSGVITELGSGNLIAGATVTLHSGDTTVTDANGSFSFANLAVGLYEMSVTRDNDFRLQIINLEVNQNLVTNADTTVNPGLPDFLAAGLMAEIIANMDDGINGSSDVTLDKNGNLYSMNNAGANIARVELDPITRANISSSIVVDGTNASMNNAWFVTVDDDLNIYGAIGNAGVFQVPQPAPGTTVTLTADQNDPTIVRDQNGINRTISKVTDVDGAGLLAGELILSSGSGGSTIPGLPQGTFNSLVSHPSNSPESIFSLGIPAGESLPVFNNNDLIKPDSNGGFLVTNSDGSAVQVDMNGQTTLLWPGNGEGKSESLAGYSSFVDDSSGNVFLRGGTDAGTLAFRMFSPDLQSIQVIATGLNQGFGGMIMNSSGNEVFISDNDLIIRIASIDGRSIADNLLNPPLNSTVWQPQITSASRSLYFETSYRIRMPPPDPNNAQINWKLLQPQSTFPDSTDEVQSSGAGSFPIFICLILSIFLLMRFSFCKLKLKI